MTAVKMTAIEMTACGVGIMVPDPAPGRAKTPIKGNGFRFFPPKWGVDSRSNDRIGYPARALSTGFGG
jgi:hypothetical protein